jgi:hypothetical protein
LLAGGADFFLVPREGLFCAIAAKLVRSKFVV